jgi:PAS domain S-box-containing protein
MDDATDALARRVTRLDHAGEAWGLWSDRSSLPVSTTCPAPGDLRGSPGDLVAVVDARGRVLAGAAIDPASGRPIALPERLFPPDRGTLAVLRRDAALSPRAVGLAMVGTRTVLFVADEIAPRHPSGEEAMVLVGASLDAVTVAELCRQSGQSLYLRRAERPAGQVTVLPFPSRCAPTRATLVEVSPERLRAELWLHDLNGRDGLVMQTEIRRPLRALGVRAVWLTTGSALAMGVLLGLALWLGLFRDLVGRLRSLQEEVAVVAREADFSRRLDGPDVGEVALVRNEVNRLLSAGEGAIRRAERTNEQLDRKLRERTRELLGVRESLATEDARSRDAEQELALARDRLNSLLDAQARAVVGVDLELRVVLHNRAAGEMLGIDSDSVGSVLRLRPEGTGEPVDLHEAVEVVGKAGQCRLEWQRVGAGGARESLETLIEPMRNERGVWTGYLIMTEDITRRKATETALRLSEQEKTVILNSLSEVITYQDTDLRLLWANSTACRDRGVSIDEIKGRHCYEVWQGSDEPCKDCPVQKAMATGRPQRGEVRTGDGRNWIVGAIPIRDVDGGVSGVVETSLDITKRTEAEEKLRRAKAEAEQASRLKSEFLANVSHEVRTPLNGIIGFSESILALDAPGQVQDQARTILRESEHLLGLINTLLDHAKIEAGKLELEYVPLEVGRLVASIVDTVGCAAREKGLELVTEIDPAVPACILGDPLRLRQVLLNLINNAVKFTHVGSVTLRVEPVEAGEQWARVRFSVIDTGVGIAPDRQERIFESFTQADGSTSRKYGGTGLGTTISRQLVSLMGGTMGLDSVEGEGSTFWFEIEVQGAEAPVRAAAAVEREPSEEAPCPPSNILVAEDYPTNQQVVRMHLETAGHRVTIAADGLQAYEACEREQFDLVFMDVQMPEMDGLEAAQKIRAKLPAYAEVPIVALTANGEIDMHLACLQAGMNDVVTKPVPRKALLQAARAWLAERGRQDASPASEVPCEVEALLADEDVPSLDEPAGQQADDAKASLDAPVAQDVGGQADVAEDGPGGLDEAPMDYDRAVEEFAGQAEMVVTVVEGFVAEVEQQLPAMRQAVEAGDVATVRAEAHKIKGGAANLTADPLSSAAAALESLAKANQCAELAVALDEVESQYRRLREFFSRRIQHQG